MFSKVLRKAPDQAKCICHLLWMQRNCENTRYILTKKIIGIIFFANN